jgi:hypothetical protein
MSRRHLIAVLSLLALSTACRQPASAKPSDIASEAPHEVEFRHREECAVAGERFDRGMNEAFTGANATHFYSSQVFYSPTLNTCVCATSNTAYDCFARKTIKTWSYQGAATQQQMTERLEAWWKEMDALRK